MITKKKKIESLIEKTNKGKLFVLEKAYAKTRIAFGLLSLNYKQLWTLINKKNPTLNPHAMSTFNGYIQHILYIYRRSLIEFPPYYNIVST